MRYRFGSLWVLAAMLLGRAALSPSVVWAACAPPTGNNVAVTCSGATVDQGPGAATGYGDGTQTGLTLNVQALASVTGTGIGINVGDSNVISNLGTITTSGGDFWGINGGASLTVMNSGSIGNANDIAGINAGVGSRITNNAGGVITGLDTAIQGAGLLGVGTATVINSGLIQAFGNTIDGGSGFLDVTNNLGGTITVDVGAAVNSAQYSVKVTNSGTISTTPGLSGIAIAANLTATVINTASGVISADGNAITAQNVVLTNAGTVSALGFAASAVFGGTVTVVNSGAINSGPSAAAIFMSSGSITNNAGGTISGDSQAIVASGNTSIFNAGTISATSGVAIAFSLSGGNTLTLAPGSVINGTAHGFGGDTFQLGGTGTASFDAALLASQYSGYTIFNKIGASGWTLTGTNAAAMPWSINAGTLNVNGTMVNSAMTVNTGGTLAGSGTVGATQINSGGRFAPGNGTAGSFMTVSGNLAFQSGAQYLLQINPATSSFATATGVANLGGATVNASFAAGAYVNRRYTILHANGGVVGSFAGPVNTNLPANFASSLSYDATNAYLNLSLFTLPSGLNANQQNVANALSNFFSSNGGIPVAFGTLTPAGLTQASGELTTGSQQTTFNAMNLFVGLLTDPFVAGRGDGAAGGAAAAAFAQESDSATAYAANGNTRNKNERDAYAAIYRKAPAAETFAQRWSVWAAGYGGSQTTEGNAALGSNTATSRVYGTAVGADYRVSPFTVAGFALAGGGTNFSIANGLGTGRSDLFQAGAFIRHAVGPAYISAALAYGWQDVTTDRTVTIAGIDQLRAKFNANAWSGRVEGGYRFVSQGFGLTPYAAGQFTTFELPNYAEGVVSGANTFALAYATKSVTATRSELGLRTDKSFAMQDGIFTLRGRVAWAHEFNPDRSIAGTFQTLPGASFIVNGAAQSRDAALTTASAEMKWLSGWSAAATFEGEFSSVTRSYAGKGVVRYAW